MNKNYFVCIFVYSELEPEKIENIYHRSFDCKKEVLTMIAQKIAEQSPIEGKAVDQINSFIEAGEVIIGNELFVALTNSVDGCLSKTTDRYKFLDFTSKYAAVGVTKALASL